MTSLEPFRRALNSGDKILFDELLNGVRKRRTAGGMLPAHDAWKPMLLSMLIECHSRITELEQLLEKTSEV
jgi:hypothetical protein